jgi:hypothetical protein
MDETPTVETPTEDGVETLNVDEIAHCDHNNGFEIVDENSDAIDHVTEAKNLKNEQTTANYSSSNFLTLTFSRRTT